MASRSNYPVHVAITRRIKPGFETEYQEALRDFLQTSFGHTGVQGATVLVPRPESHSPEIGILRTFSSEQERDSFYESAMFRAWEERVKPLTEGEPVHRELNGLEAWFRNSQCGGPPVWKMALLTFLAVWPVSMAVAAALYPLIGSSVSNTIFAGAVAAGIVLILTWVAMPVLVWIARPWLQPKPKHNQ